MPNVIKFFVDVIAQISVVHTTYAMLIDKETNGMSIFTRHAKAADVHVTEPNPIEYTSIS